MRILQLISSVFFYGAERVTAELSSALTQHGATIHVGILAVNDDLEEIFKKVINSSEVTVVQFNGQGPLNIKTIFSIGQYLKQNEIDIVHCHGYKSNLYALFARFFSRTSPFLIATNHNWIGTTRREFFYQKVDAITLRFFDKIIAVSTDVKQQMIKAGVKAQQISIIDNGINVEDIAFHTPADEIRSHLGLTGDDFVIGNIARLTPEKNHQVLLHVLAELKELTNLKLILVGDGPEYEKIQTAAGSLGLKKQVIMTGSRDDARKLYSTFDIFVLSSTTEGLPMVLLEAMAAGVPVISSDVGAVPRIIQNEKNGLLWTPENPKELSNAIRTLYTDSHLRKQFAKEGKKTVRQSFSSFFMAEEYCKQYKLLYGGGRK
ncbi:glycosyltransferase [Desulfomarina sp.]